MMMLQCPKCQSKLNNAPGIGQFCPNRDCDIIDDLDGNAPFIIKRKDVITRESVVKECIDVIMNNTDRYRKEYFAQLLRNHFGVE